MPRKRTAGGAATTAGTTFQENVAAWIVCQILAGANRTNDLELPADVELNSVTCEALQPIDDIVVMATDRTLYFQCKTSLSIGNSEEFKKVIRQFAAQFLSDGRPEDRYVLAVSEMASDVLRNALRLVLKAVRHKRGDDRISELKNFATVESKYNYLVETMREELKKLRPEEPVGEEALLSAIDRVVIFAAPFGNGNCNPDAAIDKLAIVLGAPEDAKRAWERIVNVVRGFSPNRTGGDRSMFVSDLKDEGLIAKPLAKVREAITSLQARSKSYLASLSRHTLLHYGDGNPVEIARPIVEQIYRELANGSLLLCGEAGAGKTGCLVQIARKLAQEEAPHLVIPVEHVLGGGNLLDSIGLPAGVELFEVLNGWPTTKLGFICLDGLDAARSSVSLKSILDFMHQLLAIAPNWRIIASIREYDLERSNGIQRMFRGTFFDESISSSIHGVRAIKIPELSDEEIQQISVAIPALHKLIKEVEVAQVHSLMRNVFNLDLFVDLLASGIGSNQLRSIDTQDNLLRIYWAWRIGDNATFLDSLTTLTQSMVYDRCVAIILPIELKSTLREAFSISLLVREAGLLPEDPDLVRYRHNILFDYAVSVLWLKGLSDPKVFDDLASSPDLAIVFRPSLRMTLLRLWHVDTKRIAFWSRVARLFEVEGITEITKLAATQVSAEQFREVEDLAYLLHKPNEKIRKELIDGTISAALFRLRIDREIFNIVGDDAGEWMLLGQTLAEIDTASYSYTLRNMLAAVLDCNTAGHNKLNNDQKKSFSLVACALLHEYIRDISNPTVERSLLGLAIRACVYSAAWNPNESIGALKFVLQPDVLAKTAHVILPILGDEILNLADTSYLFTEDVVRAYLNTPTPSRSQITSFGGPIVPMSSTAAQDLSMFEYSVGKEYEKLVLSHPTLAANIAMIVLLHHATNQESYFQESLLERAVLFEIDGAPRKYMRDCSYVWDSGQSYNKHELWRKTNDVVFATLTAESTDDSIRTILFNEFLSKAELGATWNRLLLAGAKLPVNYGEQLAPLLTQPFFLRELETRHATGELLRCRFGTWDAELRSLIEESILKVGRERVHADDELLLSAKKLRNSLIACLPEEKIISREVHKLSTRIHSEKSAAPPRVAVKPIVVSRVSEDEKLRESDYLKTHAQQRFFELRKDVEKIAQSQNPTSIFELPNAIATVLSFEKALRTSDVDGISAQQTSYGDGRISAAFSALANSKNAHPIDREIILQRLLQFSSHVEPIHSVEDDRDWDTAGPGWGGYLPRVEAAWGLMRFLRGENQINEATRTQIRHLSNDPVPAVRLPLIQSSLNLFNLDPGLFWDLIQHRVQNEERLVLLQSIVEVLTSFPPENEYFDKANQLILQIEARLEGISRAGFVRKSIVIQRLRRVLYLGDRIAYDWLKTIVKLPIEHSEELFELLRLCTELLSKPFPTKIYSAEALTELGLETMIQAFDVSFASWSEKPWNKVEGHDEARRIYHAVTAPMDYAVNTTSLLLDKRTLPKEPAPPEDHLRIEKQVCTFRRLIDKCVTVPIPSEAYTLLQTLQYISPVVPADSLVWVRTLVSSAKPHGFLSDSLGADLLIGVLERYLVEHRSLLIENVVVRDAIITLLDDCIKFRWPKAGSLLIGLNEVFRA